MKNLKKIFAVALVLCTVLALFSGCASAEKKLIGVWKDSSGITGYEFKKDNVCSVNADILGFSGGIDGAYTTEKRDDGNHYLTVKYTVLGISYEKTYMFAIEGDTLTLTDIESSSSSVYMRADTQSSTAASAENS